MNGAVSPARTAAIWVLSRCRRFDSWSGQTLDSARVKFSLDDRDTALCFRLCRSVLQNAALLDYYIGCYSYRLPEELEPRVLDILRLGAAQILFADRIPDSAAVNESVELIKRTNKKAAGTVNAVLRQIARNRDTLPEIPAPGTAKELSVRFSHPLWLCDRLIKDHGYEFARDFLRMNNTQPDLTVTANLCHNDAVSLAKNFRSAGYEADVSPLSVLSVRLCSSGSVTLLPGYENGDFFVQDAAAATGVIMAEPRPGMKVLDTCASPGGKSMLCAVLMGDRGEIVACDIHTKKLSLIEENSLRLGLNCVRTETMDATKPPLRFRDAFDLVIADVPCSGFGVIRKKPEIRYKDPAQIAPLPEVQLRIIHGAASCVKENGMLLYSTCTVFREENEDVVSAFLEKNRRFALKTQRTIWPQEFGTDGFYYALLKKE